MSRQNSSAKGSAKSGLLSVCLYADGQQGFTGAELAVLSLLRHEPDWRINVFLSGQATRFRRWLADRPVTVHQADTYANGFNAKPFVVRAMLEQAPGPVVWFDGDMILTRSITPLLDSFPLTHLVVAEDPPSDWPAGTRCRTRAWDLEPGRNHDRTVNSCFLRVGREHRALIDAWVAAVERPDYVAAQAAPWNERPFHFLSDQDALGALLGSKAFETVEVAMLRSGRDIAQCFFADGFSWADRLRALVRGLPPLVHAQGLKPWSTGHIPLYLDVGTYKLASVVFAADLSDQDWLRPRSPSGSIITTVCRGHASLAGIPMAAAVGTKRELRALVRGKRPSLGNDV